MFITETFSKEYVETYIKENRKLFIQKNIVIMTAGEMGIYVHHLLKKYNIKMRAFLDDNPNIAGKTIFGLPVIGFEEIGQKDFVVISSTTQAYYDRKRLLRNTNLTEEQTLLLYPSVIEYFREGFEKEDEEYFAGIEYKKNIEKMKKEMWKATDVEAIPTNLMIDLTTRCNLNCRHCTFHHNSTVSAIRNREENYLKPSRYKKLFDFADTVYLNISGEPLLSPRFWEVLDYIDASENDPFLFMTTNGLLLGEKEAKRIVDSKFKHIYISMDGASKFTYQFVRGGDFELWKKNVTFLCKTIKEKESKLWVGLEHTVCRETVTEIIDSIKLAEEMGVSEILIRPLYTSMPGTENWVVPVDDTHSFYYPQQDLKYYPHLVKQQIEKAREYAKTAKVRVTISGRFEANMNPELEDFQYPCDKEAFDKELKEKQHCVDKKYISEIPAEQMRNERCKAPWELTEIFVNGNIMHCNRMAQPEGNIHFSSIKRLRETKASKIVREGLLDGNELSWQCKHCGGCARSDYENSLCKEQMPVTLGHRFVFDLNETTSLQNLRYKGLSRIQRYGTWNNLEESELTIKLAPDITKCALDFEGEAYIISGLFDRQEVDVYVHDEKVDTWIFESDETEHRIINISERQMTNIGDEARVVKVKLVYKTGVSPISYALGRDDRKRALFINSITVK